jgi:hypothetical protein
MGDRQQSEQRSCGEKIGFHRMVFDWGITDLKSAAMGMSVGFDHRTAMLRQEISSQRREANEGAASLIVKSLDEAVIIGIFPNGQPRTRRAPGIHDFRIGLGLRADPVEQIEDQCV